MVIRAFRVCRIFRIMKSLKTVQTLLRTVLSALPNMFNIAILLCLMLFIFAVMGVQLFARVSWGDEGLVNKHANFRSFGNAFLTLARHSTGEAWNEFMYAMVSPDVPDGSPCDPDPSHCINKTHPEPGCFIGNTVCGYTDIVACTTIHGCGTDAAVPYFVLFTLVVGFVMLNLFVAVILEGFATNNDDQLWGPAHVEAFIRAWAIFDRKALGFVHYDVLTDLALMLPSPMGFAAEKSDGEVGPPARMPSEKVLAAWAGMIDSL